MTITNFNKYPSRVLILAAGTGSRFRASSGQQKHKALHPIWDNRGSLELLLTHLHSLGQPSDAITIALGYQSVAVERQIQLFVAQQRWTLPTLIPAAENYEHHTMMQTLQRALTFLPRRNTWVLFADTLYTRSALKDILNYRSKTPAIAAMPWACPEAKSKEVGVDIAQGLVTRFLPKAGTGTHQMAHAVYWPESLLSLISSAPADVKQWQLLQQRDDVNGLVLPRFAAQDIDTITDIEQLNANITPTVLRYFIANLNKDRRTANQKPDHIQQLADHSAYVKYCESELAAEQEAQVLKLINTHLPAHAPRLIEQNRKQLLLEAKRGIRLYDLLRQLSNSTDHLAIRDVLMARCNQRLDDLQQLLHKHKSSISQQPYPFNEQITDLLNAICEMTHIAKPPPHELNTLAKRWKQQCLKADSVPFRDATPKNIILVDKRLCPSLSLEQRQSVLSQLLKAPLSFWDHIPIVDLDFTSTLHLTTPADDRLSLNGHMVHGPHTTLAPADDLTLLVRYLRFGGRKFVYKLVNPAGFNTRFQFDEPCDYFSSLVKGLSKSFREEFPGVYESLQCIAEKAERWRGIAPNPSSKDYFIESQLGQPVSPCLPLYWQENPIELNHIQRLQNLVLRRPFRRSSADIKTKLDIQRKLNFALRYQQPIKFSVPFGGYKHPKIPDSPALNLAETFWLEYLREYVEPIARYHAPGVEIALSYMSGVLDFINGIPAAHQRPYITELKEHIQHFCCARIHFQLVDIADYLGGTDQARQTLELHYQAMKLAGKRPSDKAIASAARNVQFDLVVPEEGSNYPLDIEDAALRCEAMESFPERRRFNKFGEHIQLSHQRGDRSVHIGSCRTSTVQPWVGIGVYDQEKPRILSLRQWLNFNQLQQNRQ
ncbi:NTP transferase domain-containing protein [Thiocapsa imhoffii]|uniref:NTP transferase domain-containing protein n=1 Tax=Thiocapsa imhoffii TaxID=382777 RepID=UPI001905EF34